MPQSLLRSTYTQSLALLLTICSGIIAAPATGQDVFITTNGAIGSVTGDAYIGIGNYPGSQSTNTSPTVTLDNSGSVGGGINAYNGSVVNISGGSAGYLSANDSSAFSVAGGSFAFVFGANSGVITLNGGNISDSINAYNNSTITIHGGNIRNALYVADDSTLNLYGSGLSAALLAYDDSGFSVYQLQGTLADQSSIAGLTLYVADGQYGNLATVNLYNPGSTTTLFSVPEPGFPAMVAILLLGGGGVSLTRRRVRGATRHN